MVLIPVAILFIVFAVANRHLVTLSFDPFNSGNPSVATTLPLFVLIIATAILGVIAGGVATWLRQGHWRRTARQNHADAELTRAQLADLRASSMMPRSDPQRLPALWQPATGYGVSERDKQRATL